jgi:hypothetical protein
MNIITTISYKRLTPRSTFSLFRYNTRPVHISHFGEYPVHAHGDASVLLGVLGMLLLPLSNRGVVQQMARRRVHRRGGRRHGQMLVGNLLLLLRVARDVDSVVVECVVNNIQRVLCRPAAVDAHRGRPANHRVHQVLLVVLRGGRGNLGAVGPAAVLFHALETSVCWHGQK